MILWYDTTRKRNKITSRLTKQTPIIKQANDFKMTYNLEYMRVKVQNGPLKKHAFLDENNYSKIIDYNLLYSIVMASKIIVQVEEK
jgi:hypothetical protein